MTERDKPPRWQRGGEVPPAGYGVLEPHLADYVQCASCAEVYCKRCVRWCPVCGSVHVRGGAVPGEG